MPELLFDQVPWLVFAAPFIGLLCSGLVKRVNPRIEGDKVYRHDGSARLAHWTHAIGTTLLIISGLVLGTKVTASLVSAGESATLWFNVHYVFAVIFLFGTFFWAGNTIVSPWRLREHCPTKNFLKYSLNHYGSMLGIKGCTYPYEQKYFESERLAFLAALGGGALMALTGICKALAHVISMPETLMLVVTWAHDIGAILMLLFLLAHVFFGVLIPAAWKAAPSMIHGYVKLDEAREEFPAWIDSIEGKNNEGKEN